MTKDNLLSTFSVDNFVDTVGEQALKYGKTLDS